MMKKAAAILLAATLLGSSVCTWALADISDMTEEEPQMEETDQMEGTDPDEAFTPDVPAEEQNITTPNDPGPVNSDPDESGFTGFDSPDSNLWEWNNTESDPSETEHPDPITIETPVIDEAQMAENQEVNETAEMKESSAGGYVLQGYLEDGTPNYVWEGDGMPAVLESSYSMMLLDEEEPAAASVSEESYNYLKDAPRIPDTVAEMSDSTNDFFADGLHTTSNGHVRGYKSGKFFKNGRFAFDGQVYYADDSGYLYSGWLAISKTGNLSGRRKSDYVWKYCDPDTYIRFENGQRLIDGSWHYFLPEESGNLAFNKGITTSQGTYLYCDRYGICSPVQLACDTSAQGSPASAEAFLARNQLPSVDITNTVMDGSYSFYPKWYEGVSSIDFIGFTPVYTTSGTTAYCTLTDESLKGEIGCWYRNIGQYNGRQIDIKCTITDYTLYSFRGDQEVGYFQVTLNKIGLNATNLRNITAKMEFYDHETQEPVTVKGFATFADIDICQGLEILSEVDSLYVDANCMLYKSPSANLFTAPWQESLNGSEVNDGDRQYWVQANYMSDSLTYRFYSARENYSFVSDGNLLPVNGESSCVWAEDYTGNVEDYDIVNTSQGILKQGWQGLYYGRLGRVSIPPLTKTVSDSDEQDVQENTLSDEEETFIYKLSHNVPYETKEFRYRSYQVTDQVHEDLEILQDQVRVELDDGTDVTSVFAVSVSGQNVAFTARAEYLAKESFYNSNYHFLIPVRIRDTVDFASCKGNSYSVTNTGQVMYTRTLPDTDKVDTETADSNQVKTVLPIPSGKITVTKKIKESDIIWAHGNPTFLFTLEGKDTGGNDRKYQGVIVFKEDNYTTDKDGYATLSYTWDDLWMGNYQITEQKVLRYSVSETAVELTMKEPEAAVTLINEKQRYDGYSHNDMVTNTISFAS